MQLRRRLFSSVAVGRLSSASALLFTLSVSPMAHAANFYWDSDAVTAENQNGNGTWNTSNNNWQSASTAGVDAQVIWANSAADTAFIGNVSGTGYTNASTGGTITMGQDITAASLSMSSGQSGSYIIDPGAGPYTLTVGSIGNNNTTATLTINAVVAGTNFNKLNNGRVILNGASTYTGTTTISGGVLEIGAMTNLAAGGLVFAGGVLQGNGSFTRSFSSVATAAAGQLTGATGGFAAKGGALTVNFGGAGALVQLSGPSFRLGTNLIFGSATADSKVTIVNSLDLNGSSRLITVNSGTGGDSAELSGAIINQGSNSSNFTLTKAGTGLLLLSNSNSYASATAVTGGTLQIGNAKALGYGGVQTTITTGSTVSSGATLDLNGTTGVNEPIILSGTGISGIGALVNNSGTAASIGNGIAGGQVATITGTGSGYSTAPTVTISGTGSGATATATMGVTAASFAITAGDKFYTVAPTVSIAGGTGATATAILSGGATGTLTGITITNAGTGFTAAPTITFGAGTFTSGSVSGSGTGNATQFAVSGIAMTAAGSGYTGTPTYTFDSGDATPGTLKLSSVTLAGNTSIGGTGDTTINAVVSESAVAMNLSKIGAGKLTLTAANTYSGTTSITGGSIALSGSGSINASPSIIVGASTTFNVSGVTGGYTLASTQTLSGTGAVVGAASIAGTLSPGSSPGTLNTDSQTWLAGGDYNWQILNAAGVAGTGFDTIAMNGTLDLSNLTTSSFSINLWSLSATGPDVSGDAASFDNTLNQSWSLLTASGGITGFDAADFVVNVGAANGTGGFTNALGGGSFSIGTGPNSLLLNFTAVPEPTSSLLAGIGALLLLRRRRA